MLLVCVWTCVIAGDRFKIYPKIDYTKLTGISFIENQRRRIRIHKSLSNICNSEWRQLLSKEGERERKKERSSVSLLSGCFTTQDE